MWVVPAKPNCYEKMFPNLTRGGGDDRVFQLRKTPDHLPVVEVDEARWENCQRCHYYRHCYDLGMAVLSLLNAGEPPKPGLDL